MARLYGPYLKAHLSLCDARWSQERGGGGEGGHGRAAGAGRGAIRQLDPDHRPADRAFRARPRFFHRLLLEIVRPRAFAHGLIGQRGLYLVLGDVVLGLVVLPELLLPMLPEVLSDVLPAAPVLEPY